MLEEGNYTLEIRPTFIDELDATVRYIHRAGAAQSQSGGQADRADVCRH